MLSLLLAMMPGIKNRTNGATGPSKGVIGMNAALIWTSNVFASIGGGLAGGILSQTRPHSISKRTDLQPLP